MIALALVIALVLLTAGCGGEDVAEKGRPTTTKERPLPKGDPERGKEVFARQGCGNCHTFKAAGSHRDVGPNLDLVAKKYDREFILESIVDPLAYIETGEQGRIGGTNEYGRSMAPTGPDAPNEENRISEQELADLLAFLTEKAARK